MAGRSSNMWLFSLHVMLFLLLISVSDGNEEEDTFKSGRSLALEHFLPMNVVGSVVEVRDKRGLEGSGEGEEVFSEINSKLVESEGDNSTQFARVVDETDNEKFGRNETDSEGSGEVDLNPSVGCGDEGGKDCLSEVPIIGELEVLDRDISTTEESEIVSTSLPKVTVQENHLKPDEEEVSSIKPEGTIPPESLSTVEPMDATTQTVFDDTNTTEETQESTTVGVDELTTIFVTEGYKENLPTTNLVESGTTEISAPDTTTADTTESPDEVTTEDVTIKPFLLPKQKEEEDETTERQEEQTTTTTQRVLEDIAAKKPIEEEVTVKQETTIRVISEPTTTVPIEVSTSLKEVFKKISETKSGATENLAPETTPQEPVEIVEPVFKETRIAENEVQAPMGNILLKKNMTQEVDPLLIITNTILMDSEETVQLSSSEPKRLGAYIVIGLILLSFSSLVGYITFRKRMNRKKQDFESNQESNDTEKALLGLSDYKDNSELEENHLKNNEITPIVVKSNSQINKFEKNTNFSSPKNLNTIANEKNIEKDNVLKSTAENLTQVIIEDSPKDLEEDRNVPNMEKLIVKTRVDQDSIPKKAIIVNRSSGGYVPIPQDNA